MSRISRDGSVELVCAGECEDADKPTWMVDGRFNADGRFELDDRGDVDCPECGERGEPTDYEVNLVDA